MNNSYAEQKCCKKNSSTKECATQIAQKPDLTHSIKVLYTNYRGETAARSIVPIKPFWGKSEYHPEEQWLLEVWDIEKDALRIYALKDIKQWFID